MASTFPQNFISMTNKRFLLASFQLKYLLSFLSQPKKLVKALSTLPSTMEDIYDEIMQRICDDGETDSDLAICALSWVFHTASGTGARPLRMDEILDLLVVDPGESELNAFRSSAEDVISVCKGLIIHDEINGVVRFPHLTVQEYLRNSKKLKPISYMAQICTTYLCFDEFENECDSLDTVKERLEKFKAAEFVANYWSYYARGAQHDGEVQDAIYTFLKSEKKSRSMLQMQIYREAVPDPEEGNYFDWDWVCWRLRGQGILEILANNGLNLLCEIFLDGKSPVKDGYEDYSQSLLI
jgi:hypothetical protein